LTLLLSMALVGHVVAAPVEPAPEPARARARALMQEGAQQMDDRQYDKAVESFSEAYRLVPSPKVLYNLGIAYLSVGALRRRAAGARRISQGGDDAPARNQATARRHVADLRASRHARAQERPARRRARASTAAASGP